jgi:hypothetical protein
MVMRSLSTVSLLILTLVFAASAAAQDRSIDADRLPVDIDRIVRQLEPDTEIEVRDGLRLRYTVSVYGEAPAIRLFSRGESLTTGPVPYTAPTHQEFMDFWTPQIYRSPTVDMGFVGQWLIERLAWLKGGGESR